MSEHTFTDATVKRLQLTSGLLEVLVDLIAQGAKVESEVVTRILYKLVQSINEAIQQIEDKKDDNSIKDRSSPGGDVDIT